MLMCALRMTSSRLKVIINLTVVSTKAQAFTAFLGGKLIGTGWELSHSGGIVTITAQLNMTGYATPSSNASSQLLVLMSTSLGIHNGGGIQSGVKGITSSHAGSVMLGSTDITTSQSWTHISGSAGEAKHAGDGVAASGVPWTKLATRTTTTAPMTWLTTEFATPAEVVTPDSNGEVSSTLNLDVVGLSRGRFYVNGMDLGRYWSKLCGGAYLCQRYYPIPFDILTSAATGGTCCIARTLLHY